MLNYFSILGMHPSCTRYIVVFMYCWIWLLIFEKDFMSVLIETYSLNCRNLELSFKLKNEFRCNLYRIKCFYILCFKIFGYIVCWGGSVKIYVIICIFLFSFLILSIFVIFWSCVVRYIYNYYHYVFLINCLHHWHWIIIKCLYLGHNLNVYFM